MLEHLPAKATLCISIKKKKLSTLWQIPRSTSNLCARQREKREAMEDAGGSGRRTRTRGAEAVARSAALERLRAIRDGSARAAAVVQVKVDAQIYDTVAEEDYATLVTRRHKDAGEFVIDDDRLSYADDGREEDWAHRALPSSDQGSRRRGRRPPQAKAAAPSPGQAPAAAVRGSGISASLCAAAAMMGKQHISSMFTSSVVRMCLHPFKFLWHIGEVNHSSFCCSFYIEAESKGYIKS